VGVKAMKDEIGSLYWVITHRCNGGCGHCYMKCGPDGPSLTFDDADRVIENLPRRINHQIIVSGGEILLPENRHLLFHVTEGLLQKYGRRQIAIQTNGDFLDSEAVDECIAGGITHISVASIDGHHHNRFESLREKDQHYRELLKSKGLIELPSSSVTRLSPRSVEASARIVQALCRVAPDLALKPTFLVWGANDKIWLRGNWARGRALQGGIFLRNEKHNFCAIWSGGRNFLRAGSPRQEVVLQLSYLFPCCPSTRVYLADTRKEPLIRGLERAMREPVFRAINRGRPYEGAGQFGIPPAQASLRFRELKNICMLCDELLAHLDQKVFPPSPFQVYTSAGSEDIASDS